MKTFITILGRVLWTFIFLVKLLLKGLPVFLKGLGMILSFIPKLLTTFHQRIKRLFRFSITFKITVFYSLIFSLLFFSTSIGILAGFKLFLVKHKQPLQMQNLYLNGLGILLFAANVLCILITIITGSRVSRKMLRPIQTMNHTVKAITINNLDTRLDLSGSHDELKDLAETFNAMIDRIQTSYEQQNQFVSDASHELRTPIAVVQGYANLLDRWGKNDQAVLEESIQAIKTESENMKELTEKLLFLARSDKHRQKIEKVNFELNELIDEVIKEARLIDEQHEFFNISQEQIALYADRKLVKQALRIFVDNSIKFTPERGIIKINAYSKKNQLLLIIEDTGIGIPKEDLPHIFDRFYRSDKSRTKQSGGHGLGLSIARWIVEIHGGTIEVQSTVQVGTRFIIYLPYKSL